ncbi:acyltransferase [Rhodoblastus sp.]|uniref:acyltransferase n=1 Tax=Rhodoblastus sp. TaxID=1962975 RepID=UPI003F98A828
MTLQIATHPFAAPFDVLHSRWKLRRCAALGASPSVVGRVWIHGSGTLRVGDHVRLDASSAPIELFVGPGAEMVLGDGVEILGGTSIEALQSVRVGDGCRIGAKCKVMDNNFHHAASDRLLAPPSVPVVIEAGATLETGVIVLPGAHVPHGKVVARGAVVRGRPAPAAAAPATPAKAGAAEPRQSLLRRALMRLRTDPLAALRFEIARLRGAVLLRNCRRGARVFAFGDVRVRNEGVIRLGSRVGFREGMIPTELVCHKGAEIGIGAGTYFNYAAFIEARQSVTIGKRCLIASMARIADTAEGASGPIAIGDDVWIAHGAMIAPGVSVGAGSVISAGSVVTKDVPPRSLVIGDPARVMPLSVLAAGGCGGQ